MTKTLESRYTHWQSIMERYEASGLSQQKFCEVNEINFKQFKYYRWQLAARDKRKQKSILSDEFTPVLLNTPGIDKLQIKHPSGIDCQIPCDIEPTRLLKIIQGLLSC